MCMEFMLDSPCFFSIFTCLCSGNKWQLYFVGEALGAIGSADVLELLHQYSKDPVTEVRNCQRSK